MIKFDKNEFLKPQIYSTLDEYKTRCNVTEEIIKEIEQLQQENKILKENAKHNDKVVDKVNWENMLLKKENKQLKALQEKIEDETMSEKIDIQNNWNKLKEYLHNQIPTDKTVLTKHIKIFEVLDKMQELEGSDSNE